MNNFQNSPIFLFILCSLGSWLCPPPAPDAQPTAVPVQTFTPPTHDQTAEPTAEPATEPPATPTPPTAAGPFWGSGQIWAGVNEHDTGYCPGYGMPDGNGGRPSLVWPVPGGVLNERRGFRIGHSGLDIVAPEGSPVVAAAGGVVVWAGWSSWGFGMTVAVSHGGGWWSLYGHLSAVSVTCGQWVSAGAVIGAVGDTGSATRGYFHLHFEIRMGAYSYEPF